jgi:hypothetical protein
MPTPYAEHVGGRDPVHVLRRSLDAYREIAPHLTSHWDTPWAPGKWTAKQIVLHVAQWEMIFGIRCRCALALPNYVIQPMEPDPFMTLEGPAADGPGAVMAFEAVRGLNLALAGNLTAAQRATRVRHPERGEIDVTDLLVTMAGHSVHHLRQLEGLTSRRSA